MGSATTFGGMFEDSAFNQDLCMWSAHLDPADGFTGAFSGTNCPSTAEPDLGASPISPLCHVCHQPSSAPSEAPTPVPSLTPSGIPSPVPSESPSGPVILTRADLNAARDDWIDTGTSVSLDYPTISIYHCHAKE